MRGIKPIWRELITTEGGMILSKPTEGLRRFILSYISYLRDSEANHGLGTTV